MDKLNLMFLLSLTSFKIAGLRNYNLSFIYLKIFHYQEDLQKLIITQELYRICMKDI